MTKPKQYKDLISLKMHIFSAIIIMIIVIIGGIFQNLNTTLLGLADSILLILVIKLEKIFKRFKEKAGSKR